MAMDEKAALNAGKVFLWMLVAFGSWLIWTGMEEPGKNPRAHWKTVFGRVTETAKKEAWTDSTGQHLVGPKGFDITIKYRYEADGESYWGASTYYDPSSLAVPKYGTGERLMVYYDPDSPVRSSLLSGDEMVVTKEMKSANVISGTLILLSGLFFQVMLRMKTSKKY